MEGNSCDRGLKYKLIMHPLKQNIMYPMFPNTSELSFSQHPDLYFVSSYISKEYIYDQI